MRIPRFALCMTLAAACLCGCQQSSSRTRADQPLMPTQNPVISDIPVPIGFKIDLKHTFYNSTSGLRTGYATYSGRGKTAALLDFYRDNMPMSGWALVRESTNPSSGSYTLHFQKENEGTDVRITPGAFSFDVVVSFYPLSPTRK